MCGSYPFSQRVDGGLDYCRSSGERDRQEGEVEISSNEEIKRG